MLALSTIGCSWKHKQANRFAHVMFMIVIHALHIEPVFKAIPSLFSFIFIIFTWILHISEFYGNRLRYLSFVCNQTQKISFRAHNKCFHSIVCDWMVKCGSVKIKSFSSNFFLVSVCVCVCILFVGRTL